MAISSTLDRDVGPASGRLTVAIDGLNAAHGGAERIATVLEGTPGVVRAYVNPDTEMAYVEYRQLAVTPGKLIAAIEAEGLATGDATVDHLPAVAEDVITVDHSCCARSTPATGSTLTGQAETGTRSAFTGSRAQGTWPFKIRLTLFLAAVVVVLGTALWLVRPMSSTAMGADYSVNMSMTGFTPPNFSIPAGKPVTIQLNNVDSPFHGVINGALHQFAIDDLGVDVRLDGKQSSVITLPALEPGTYQFYCNVCCGGKINPSMQGNITVTTEGVAQR